LHYNKAREEIENVISILGSLRDGELDIILDGIAKWLVNTHSLSFFEKAHKNNDTPRKKLMIAIF
jgi:hypothetical protein